jgi:predicted nucleic acid-binding protein
MILTLKMLKKNITKKNMEYKHIFLDTNILVDLVANRKPFSENAISIFDYCQKSNIKMYSTSHSIATLHYIAKKMVDEKELRLIIEDLLDTISIIAVTESILKKSLKSNHKDFEDAIQIVSAQSFNDMNCIVTRDLKDYKYAEINVLTPDDFLSKL